MAYIKTRRLFWELPAGSDATHTEIYSGVPGDADFLDNVDTRQIAPLDSVPVPDTEYFLRNIPEGSYQFAVVAGDDAGNYSDPYQHPAWVNVPLDVTPPAAPFGGGID